jgi:RNAse (barnase) inhibitor barstar
MSGLAKLLSGRTQAGVYHWSSAGDPAQIAHSADAADWMFVHLDTWSVEDKAGFLLACKEAFDFPDWVGMNFDALGDALSDVRTERGGILVLWDGWSPLARADRRSFDVAVDVFAERVDFVRAGVFAVVLRGPGPTDTEVPELDPHPA